MKIPKVLFALICADTGHVLCAGSRENCRKARILPEEKIYKYVLAADKNRKSVED